MLVDRRGVEPRTYGLRVRVFIEERRAFHRARFSVLA